MSRYVVRELEGYPITPADLQGRRSWPKRAGLSVYVMDALVAHRVVASWRTEELGGTHYERRTAARTRAAALAATLNAAEFPPC